MCSPSSAPGSGCYRSPGCHLVAAADHALVLRVRSRRHRQLSSLRTQATCRLHAALCEIIPGGVPRNITANRAAAILDTCVADSAVAAAWHGLAVDHLADLRRIDTRLADTRKRITTAVEASGTTLTSVLGVGPVIAATILGYVADPSRFPTADKFASYNGTAPIGVSSGNRKIFRPSMRGNRRLNHVIHLAAVTQIAHKHSQGHAYYQRKLAAGVPAGIRPAGHGRDGRRADNGRSARQGCAGRCDGPRARWRARRGRALPGSAASGSTPRRREALAYFLGLRFWKDLEDHNAPRLPDLKSASSVDEAATIIPSTDSGVRAATQADHATPPAHACEGMTPCPRSLPAGPCIQSSSAESADPPARSLVGSNQQLTDVRPCT